MKALLVSAAAVGLLTAAPAFAQSGAPDSAQGTAAAEIVAPISIEPSNQGGALNFGRLAAPATDSSVTVIADGSRSSATPNILIAGGTASSAAHFSVTGAAGLSYTATTDAGTTITDGTTVLNVDLDQYDNGDSTYVLDGTGNDEVIVGGTLSVPAGTAAGTYAGTFNVQVQYN